MSSLSPLPDHDDPDYVLFKDLPDGKMNVELVYADLQHGEYVVPLGNNIPSEVFSDNDHLLDANKWENTLVPLRLRRYLDEDRRDKGHLRPGWLYLFRNGHLWRELQIIGRYGVNLYQDVNLTEYKGKDQRPATAEAESHVLIPYQFGNKAEPFEIAYSEIQWTWARIQSYRRHGQGRPPDETRGRRLIRAPMTTKRSGAAKSGFGDCLSRRTT